VAGVLSPVAGFPPPPVAGVPSPVAGVQTAPAATSKLSILSMESNGFRMGSLITRTPLKCGNRLNHHVMYI
jgi:hypothetical protein